jgi:hypothetical protein
MDGDEVDTSEDVAVVGDLGEDEKIRGTFETQEAD